MISRIVITWVGCPRDHAGASVPRAFVPVRIVLGVAEAGDFFRHHHYLTFWFRRPRHSGWPVSSRARVAGIITKLAFGSHHSGLGRGEWTAWMQWSSCWRAFPPVILRHLRNVIPEGPSEQAEWWPDDEPRGWPRALRKEEKYREGTPRGRLWRPLTDRASGC